MTKQELFKEVYKDGNLDNSAFKLATTKCTTEEATRRKREHTELWQVSASCVLLYSLRTLLCFKSSYKSPINPNLSASI